MTPRIGSAWNAVSPEAKKRPSRSGPAAHVSCIACSIARPPVLRNVPKTTRLLLLLVLLFAWQRGR
jgi:hypothetical protein